MANYNNLDALLKGLQKKIDKVMINDVGNAVRDAEQAEIDNTVYASYNPKKYKRRYNNNGLRDTENISIKKIGEGTIEVKNETPPNLNYGSHNADESLAYMVITGTGYDYGNGNELYNAPRDFVQATKDTLNSTKLHKTALIEGLKKEGIDVK